MKKIRPFGLPVLRSLLFVLGIAMTVAAVARHTAAWPPAASCLFAVCAASRERKD